MKNHPIIPLACVIGLILGTTLGAINQERIRWRPNLLFGEHWESGAKVEFGLRYDGVVVWREIMPAVTNSPAEQFEMGTITNVLMTNKLYGDWGL